MSRYDHDRTGAQLNEHTLRPENVNQTKFGKLYELSVDGHVYAQPLYKQNVQVSTLGRHNVLFVVTMHNTVHAFDVDANDTKKQLSFPIRLEQVGLR